MDSLRESISQSFSKRLPTPNTGPDAEQMQAIRACADLIFPVLTYLEKKSARHSPIRRLTARLGRRSKAPSGIYLWGDVGRGKTVLMDAVFDVMNPRQYRRVHFHRFMLEVHERLDIARQTERDPLRKVGQDLACDTAVLGIDEFQVSDIGDAMILFGLLRALIERHVVLIFTSNTPPAALYDGGLQRDRFVPAIALIEKATAIVQLRGGRDYRLETLDTRPSYHVPNDSAAHQQLQSLLLRIDPAAAYPAEPIMLRGRSIPIQGLGNGVIWFDFQDLCEGPRSKLDYVDLSKRHHTLLLSGVPQLDDDDNNAARRFIELIDELYDRRVNVVITAAALPDALYRGQRLRDEFQRTASRLVEFQSAHYLSQAHRP